MTLKPFVLGEDYPEICEWWRARDWKAPASQRLSRLIGLVALDDKGKHAAAWLYHTGSSWALLEYVVTNPSSPLKVRGEAVKVLIEKLKEIAKGEGFENVVTFTNARGLQRLLQRHGFKVADRELTSLVWGAV